MLTRYGWLKITFSLQLLGFLMTLLALLLYALG